MGRTGFVYHPDYLKHDMGPAHPESPARLQAIVSLYQALGGGWEPRMERPVDAL